MGKKILAILMTALIIGSCVGCAGTQAEAPAPTEAAKVETQAATEAATEAVVEEVAEAVSEYKVAPKNGKNYVVGFSVTEVGTTVMQNLSGALEAAGKEKGFEVITAVCDNSTEKQIADVESFVTSDVDLVIMLPFNSEGAAPAVKALNEANIPCICVLRNTLNVEYLIDIKHDSYMMGQKGGQEMAELLGGKGKVIEIVGAPGVANSEVTSQGFHDALAEYPDIEIIATQPGFYQAAKAQETMESILTSVGDGFDGVYVQNGDMTTGTYLAMKSFDIDTSKKAFVGGNFTEAAYERIMSGEQAADITTPMAEMGRLAIEAADEYFLGKELSSIDIPVDVVTKDNADSFKDVMN